MDNRSRSRLVFSWNLQLALGSPISLSPNPTTSRDSPTKENHQKPSSTFLVVVSSLKLPAAQVPSKHTLAGHTLSLWGTRHRPASTGYLRFLPPLARTRGFFLPLANLALIPGGQRSHPGVALLKYTSSFAFSIRLDQSYCIGGETCYQGPRKPLAGEGC